jgi:hypothetical protein
MLSLPNLRRDIGVPLRNGEGWSGSQIARQLIEDQIRKGVIAPPSLHIGELVKTRVGPFGIKVRPVTRGVKPLIPSVYMFPPGHPSLPEQFKPIVKAPRFRPTPLKYMLDNGLTPSDLANE